MNFNSLLRRPLLLALPALLAFSACSDKKDEPAPAQGQVLFINVASNIPAATLGFNVDNVSKASLPYGSNSQYQNVDAGSRVLQVLAGTQAAFTQSLTVTLNQKYTFLATPGASVAAVGGLLIPDDLTLPTAGKAKIRLVHVGQNIPTPIRLAQVTALPGAAIIVNDQVANATSTFQEFTPGTYSLTITDNANAELVALGDGTGTGAGTRTFEANKIYTVVVSGTRGSLDASQKLKAFLFQNN